jgi:hypothetical protein
MNWRRMLFIALLALLLGALPVLAQGITIDGNFSDWAGKASLVDPGGADDETTPPRADITEFRADADSNGLYLLKAWDDTKFTGDQESTAGITLRTANNTYYRIYTTAQGNPGTVPLSSLRIKQCTDSTCQTQTDICTGTGCTGAQAGSGTSWTDPFSGRTSPDCNGTNCGTQDTAVELFIPWSLIGGAPGSGQFIFLQFGSYPSGSGQAPEDDTGLNGIACKNVGGSFQCYRSTPTAVTLRSFAASSLPMNAPAVAGTFGALVLLTVATGVICLGFLRRSKSALGGYRSPGRSHCGSDEEEAQNLLVKRR